MCGRTLRLLGQFSRVPSLPQTLLPEDISTRASADYQIFNEDGEASIGPHAPTSAPVTANSSTFALPEPSQLSVIVEETSVLLSETPPVSPAGRGRATVVRTP